MNFTSKEEGSAKKILQVIDNLATGGAEKLIITVVPLLNDRKITTDVLLLDGRKYPFYGELEKEACCNIFSLGMGTVYNPLHVLKIIPYLRKYDVVHVHLFPAQYWVVFAKILSFSNTKLIFTEHSTSNRRIQRSIFKWIEKFVYRSYDTIICITKQVELALTEHLRPRRDQLVTLQNGIDINTIAAAAPASRSDFNFTSAQVVLVMVAGFRREKDQDTLIKALQILPPNYQLLLIGDGERRATCEELAKGLDVSERIQFLGIRTDVYEILKMADLLIMSSHWEGFGLAAVEGMAAGIPVIASAVNGLSQVVEGAGLLFEKGNLEDLKQKIMYASNEDVCHDLVRKGKARAARFDIKLMVDKLVQIYDAD